MSPPAAAAQTAPGTRAREALRRGYGPPRPRRVSGPARRTPVTRPAHARSQRGSFLLWPVAALERLASHRLLDRLIRGRAWLMVVTFALIGIVTLQLALLKLNGAVGRALHTQALLQRENVALSIENSELSSADRVQAGGAQLGLAFATSASLRFLAPTFHGDFGRGAAALASPLHAPASGSEQGASARAGGSSGEGSGSERGEGHAGEAGATEGRAGEGRTGEGRTGEGGSAEAHAGEGGGSQSASGAGESGRETSASAAGSEAPASSGSPTHAEEGAGAGEASSSGGASARSGG